MAIKKTYQHLQFYMDCMRNDCLMPMTGVSIIKGGLCRAANVGLISESILELFSSGFSEYHYWADDNNDGDPFETRHNFNPLRQTIVLFMACLNNEL